MGKVSKHRVLVAGIFSPLLALVLNIIFIQTLLALSSNPENNWRFRLFISSLALQVPFLATLVLALKDRRRADLSLSAKIGLGIAELSLLLIAKPAMDGLAHSKQSRNMAMHDVPAPMFNSLDIQGKPQRCWRKLDKPGTESRLATSNAPRATYVKVRPSVYMAPVSSTVRGRTPIRKPS